MKQQRGKAWTPAEDTILEREYPEGGVAAVRALTGRSKSSIVNRAAQIGVTCDWRKVAEDAMPAVVVPAMTLTESLACIQFRKWGGPVNREQPMRWRVAA